DYRRRVTDAESASMWQSLSFGANYKSAYCMAVCPAGDDVIAPFLTDRPRYLQEVVRPLQDKEETVYVVPNSDAEDYVARRFPHKHPKRVGNSLHRVRSIQAFLNGLPFTFQCNRSKGLDATYHFGCVPPFTHDVFSPCSGELRLLVPDPSWSLSSPQLIQGE